MNERINQLNREAQAYATRIVGEDEIYFNIWVEMYKVKLAELIVRECMSIANGNGSDFTAKDIAEHFGVKE